MSDVSGSCQVEQKYELKIVFSDPNKKSYHVRALCQQKKHMNCLYEAL